MSEYQRHKWPACQHTMTHHCRHAHQKLIMCINYVHRPPAPSRAASPLQVVCIDHRNHHPLCICSWLSKTQLCPTPCNIPLAQNVSMLDINLNARNSPYISVQSVLALRRTFISVEHRPTRRQNYVPQKKCYSMICTVRQLVTPTP